MNRPKGSHEERQSHLAPELDNSEQDDHLSQAQDVTDDARQITPATDRPLQSKKGPGKTDLMNDSTQDIVDHMRDMNESGRIDMSAYQGEPNMDDNTDKYGPANKLDDLPGDGASGKPARPAR
ncbi:hypothetical protein [Altericroceibacterium xinjiangense]|uniref:hypothetical protein n=1 Tax=Altericroceibacterium xinjiangense TaxID=762261 RepID=UPI000F7DCF4C|nr:hypothetical protein [Altericroceibacterium xinjiangense]